MGQTKKRNYDRYTLTFKAQAVKLAKHPDVKLILPQFNRPAPLGGLFV